MSEFVHIYRDDITDRHALGFWDVLCANGRAQTFFYDRENGRKLQFTMDLLNFSNLLNRNWGLYRSSSYNLRVLEVKSLSTDAAGNKTPTYHFNPQTISYSDFYSRWRFQLGFRLTF